MIGDTKDIGLLQNIVQDGIVAFVERFVENDHVILITELCECYDLAS
jgi:hypothetical protein